MTVVLSACASSELKPPPYIADDNVQDIPEELIVGKWRSTPLNPAVDTTDSYTIIEYLPDGKLLGSIQNAADETLNLPALQLQLSGNWSTDGEWLRHSDIKLKAIGNSAYANQYNQLLSASSRELGSVTNVLELSDEKMITISKDGRASLFIRQ